MTLNTLQSLPISNGTVLADNGISLWDNVPCSISNVSAMNWDNVRCISNTLVSCTLSLSRGKKVLLSQQS